MTTKVYPVHSSDGQIYAVAGSWSGARGATTGTVGNTFDPASVMAGKDGSTYYVFRVWQAIDCTSDPIPEGATITEIRVKGWCPPDGFSGGATVCLVEGQQASATALAASDFGLVGSVELSDTRISAPCAYSLVLNAAGLALFDGAGPNKYAFLDLLDLSNSAPTAGEPVTISCAECATEAHRPTVEVDYTTIATPTMDPTTGSHVGSVDVTLACATEGAAIYYTTDGSTPDATKTLYESAVHLTATTTLKAIAVKSGDTDSAVASEVYTITEPPFSGPQYEDGFTATDPVTNEDMALDSASVVVSHFDDDGAKVVDFTGAHANTEGSDWETGIPIADLTPGTRVKSRYTGVVGATTYHWTRYWFVPSAAGGGTATVDVAAIADAVRAELATELATLTLLAKLALNKEEVTETSITVYDDDDTTPIATMELSDNGMGTATRSKAT
jgi:hypothetical protein